MFCMPLTTRLREDGTQTEIVRWTVPLLRETRVDDEVRPNIKTTTVGYPSQQRK